MAGLDLLVYTEAAQEQYPVILCEDQIRVPQNFPKIMLHYHRVTHNILIPLLSSSFPSFSLLLAYLSFFIFMSLPSCSLVLPRSPLVVLLRDSPPPAVVDDGADLVHQTTS